MLFRTNVFQDAQLGNYELQEFLGLYKSVQKCLTPKKVWKTVLVIIKK